MARRIKITQELLEGYKQRFVEQVEKMRVFDGKLSFTANFAEVDDRTTVFFTERAFLKQMTLVQASDKEVAWHGTAKRLENNKGYLIEDIFVYPQVVTGVTVTTDQQKYEEWLDGLDDEQFNNLRFHGHSHVNMATSPSRTDEDHYEGLMRSLSDNGFYVFFITNKAGARTTMVYDLSKNVMYEPKDVSVVVIGESNLAEFLHKSKEMVTVEVVPQTQTYGRTYGTYFPPAYGNDKSVGTNWKSTVFEKKEKKKKGQGKSSITPLSGTTAPWLQDEEDDDFYEYLEERYGRRT